MISDATNALMRMTPAAWDDMLPLSPAERARYICIPYEQSRDAVAVAQSAICEILHSKGVSPRILVSRDLTGGIKGSPMRAERLERMRNRSVGERRTGRISERALTAIAHRLSTQRATICLKRDNQSNSGNQLLISISHQYTLLM